MIWTLFILLIFGLLALDLGVFHKKDKEITIKESLAWTGFWVFIALSFSGVVYWLYDSNSFNINPKDIPASKAMIEYLTGYLIEESLSLDNIFVIALIFIYFKIDSKFQHNILFWGIIGAIFFRLIMILLGTSFVERFEWSMYVFGGILIYSAIRMLIPEKEEKDFKDSIAIKLLEKIYPIDWEVNHRKYFIKKKWQKNGYRFIRCTCSC